MILTAHQPTYLPWLGLIHKIMLADAYVSFDDVQYVPKEWINRNKIKTQNGPIWLTVPVLDKGYLESGLTIKDIMINNNLPWRKKHWMSIYLNYKKAPYFNQTSDFFEDLYKQDWVKICDLNEYVLKYLLKELGIDVSWHKLSEMTVSGSKNDLVLSMCKELNTDLYIFGALGKDYADVKSFNDQGMDVMFQEYIHPKYPQLHGEFESHLSILDLLFNVDIKNVKDIILMGNISKDQLKKSR
ncbi:MAG: hypothetical protein A2Y40_02120 [Candidatus Margulisbacteria bacterium GWF2_35_9]|nr:MAG: hypothetical protein A2Y40_02120 [Candidatus Margulisbacteria bacterium GWF2_35_9]